MQRPSQTLRSEQFFICEISCEMSYPNLWRFVWRRRVTNRMGTDAEAGNQQKHLLLRFVTKA